jgi:hypothetical protein
VPLPQSPRPSPKIQRATLAASVRDFDCNRPLSLRKSPQLGAKVIGILTVAEGASKPASLTAI